MKHPIFPIFLALFLFFPQAAFAAQYDLSGDWNYATSDSWGPHNKDTSGTCTIKKNGKAFTFTFETGYRWAGSMRTQLVWICGYGVSP